MKRIAAIYGIGIIITFGHAHRTAWNEASQYQKDNGFPVIGAIFASVMWPIYWSDQFWK